MGGWSSIYWWLFGLPLHSHCRVWFNPEDPWIMQQLNCTVLNYLSIMQTCMPKQQSCYQQSCYQQSCYQQSCYNSCWHFHVDTREDDSPLQTRPVSCCFFGCYRSRWHLPHQSNRTECHGDSWGAGWFLPWIFWQRWERPGLFSEWTKQIFESMFWTVARRSQGWMQGFSSLARAKGLGVGHTCRGWWMQDYHANCPADVQLCINSWGDRAFCSGPSSYCKTAGQVGLWCFFILWWKSLSLQLSLSVEFSGMISFQPVCQVLPNGSSRALNFRYDIEADEVVNSFFPKQLPENANQLELKPSHFGAAFLGRLDKLPFNSNVCTIYEAIVCVYLGACSCFGVCFHQHAVCCRWSLRMKSRPRFHPWSQSTLCLGTWMCKQDLRWS